MANTKVNLVCRSTKKMLFHSFLIGAIRLVVLNDNLIEFREKSRLIVVHGFSTFLESTAKKSKTEYLFVE